MKDQGVIQDKAKLELRRFKLRQQPITIDAYFHKGLAFWVAEYYRHDAATGVHQSDWTKGESRRDALKRIVFLLRLELNPKAKEAHERVTGHKVGACLPDLRRLAANALRDKTKRKLFDLYLAPHTAAEVWKRDNLATKYGGIQPSTVIIDEQLDMSEDV